MILARGENVYFLIFPSLFVVHLEQIIAFYAGLDGLIISEIGYYTVIQNNITAINNLLKRIIIMLELLKPKSGALM